MPVFIVERKELVHEVTDNNSAAVGDRCGKKVPYSETGGKEVQKADVDQRGYDTDEKEPDNSLVSKPRYSPCRKQG